MESLMPRNSPFFAFIITSRILSLSLLLIFFKSFCVGFIILLQIILEGLYEIAYWYPFPIIVSDGVEQHFLASNYFGRTYGYLGPPFLNYYRIRINPLSPENRQRNLPFNIHFSYCFSSHSNTLLHSYFMSSSTRLLMGLVANS